MLRRIAVLARALFRRSAVEAELDEELRYHLEREAERHVANGMSPNEARLAAKRAFGHVGLLKEEVRDVWGARWVHDLAADARYGARALRRAPGFTLVAAVALGLGIGANAAVFSLVDAVAFRPLPAAAPDRLVALFGRQGRGDDYLSVSYRTYEDLRRAVRGFTDVAAFREGPVNLAADATASADAPSADVAWAAHVSGNYFTVLGVRPVLGRALRPDDERQSVVVIGDALWRNRFAADPAVIGHAVRVNGAPFTVVGVMPPEFTGTRLFSFAPALWTPIGVHARTIPGSDSLLTSRTAGGFTLLGRLDDGVTVARAEAAANDVARRLAADIPDVYAGLSFRVFSNRTPINVWFGPPERMRAVGRVALFGVALVLLIACADVANLLLARMTARRREVAIRLSLGVSRGRLVRQFLVESLLLALLGLAAAVPLALLAIRASGELAPPTDYATAFRPTLDGRVLLFAAGVATLAGVVFGLAPALQASRPGIVRALREAGPGATSRRSRFRDALVVAQVTLSLVVLVTAALFARSLRNARATDPGFRVGGAVVFTLDPRLGGGYDRAHVDALYRTLLDRLAALPGVLAVSRATSLPLDGSSNSTAIWPDGRGTPADEGIRVDYSVVGEGYFAALGTPVVAGRDFALADTAAAVDPVVVNEVLARRLWPNEPALGRRLRYGPKPDDVAEVVGVMRTATYRHVGEAPRAAFAFSLLRNPVSRTTVLVRHAGDPARLYPAIRREVARLDANLPVIGLKTLREHIASSYSAAEGGAWGAGVFGLLALLLAASGIYGVISYAVTQRTREIAIRVALGARGSQVVRMVLAGGARLAALGIVLGAALTLAATRALAGLLYGVAPHDPLVIGGVALGLGAIALLASAVPAWRATRVDTIQALRAE
jgi:predicted permease